jgi:hypothetical protein
MGVYNSDQRRLTGKFRSNAYQFDSYARAREPPPLKVKSVAKYDWILTRLDRLSSGGGASGDVRRPEGPRRLLPKNGWDVVSSLAVVRAGRSSPNQLRKSSRTAGCWRWIGLQSVAAVLPAFAKSGLPQQQTLSGWLGTSAWCRERSSPDNSRQDRPDMPPHRSRATGARACWNWRWVETLHNNGKG